MFAAVVNGTESSDTRQDAGEQFADKWGWFGVMHRLCNGEIINLEGDIPSWSNNKIFVIENLNTMFALPVDFNLDKAYPNPFNPTTTLSFAIPVDFNVSLSIYNMQGREVSMLIDGNMDTGSFCSLECR